MAVIKPMRALMVVLAITSATSLYAQAPVPAAGPPAAPGAPTAPPKVPVPEPKLVFDREVFSYGGNGRRDPFKPLIGKESLGPLFEDLKLKGIIYSNDPTRSIVLIQDGAKKLYRVRRGEVIGNSRVVEIRPLAVRFAVENFGMLRYEVIELTKTGQQRGPSTPAGTAEAPAQAAPTAPAQNGPGPIVNLPPQYQGMTKAQRDAVRDSMAAEKTKARNNPPPKQNNNDDEGQLQPEARP